MAAVQQSPIETEGPPQGADQTFTSAELGALAHLYRGEVYRSTIWRTRLDNTTNWAVVTLGIALSISYSDVNASPLPLLLVGLLIILFVLMEARRYRYFNVWRARARWLETHLYAPMLRRESYQLEPQWKDRLALDYCEPKHHISYARAIGRRLRRNYFWILGIQAMAYFGKLIVHPTPLTSFAELWERAAIGPIPGQLVLMTGLLFNAFWIIFTFYMRRLDQQKHSDSGNIVSMG